MLGNIIIFVYSRWMIADNKISKINLFGILSLETLFLF
jgi:hypothetical protein